MARLRPNNSFKPKPLRSGKNMAGKACHVFTSATRFGLTQALDGTEAMQQLETFSHTADIYCQWAEGRLSFPEDDANTAIKLLSQLFAQAQDLPDLFDDEDAPDLSHEQWKTIYKRFASLPFNYYSTYLDPHLLESSSPGIGDLADDLADIWRDLKGGLFLYQKGNLAAAACEWRESFQMHWGRHIVSALYALQCWRT